MVYWLDVLKFMRKKRRWWCSKDLSVVFSICSHNMGNKLFRLFKEGLVERRMNFFVVDRVGNKWEYKAKLKRECDDYEV